MSLQECFILNSGHPLLLAVKRRRLDTETMVDNFIQSDGNPLRKR